MMDYSSDQNNEQITLFIQNDLPIQNKKINIIGHVYKLITKREIDKLTSLKFLKSLYQKWGSQDVQMDDGVPEIDNPNKGPRDQSKNSFFKVRSENDTYLCCSRTHFPVRVHDVISGEMEIVEVPEESDQIPGGYYYQFTRPPLGLVGINQKAFFHNLASFSNGKVVGPAADEIYQQLIDEGLERSHKSGQQGSAEIAFNQMSYLAEGYRLFSVDMLDKILGNLSGELLKSILNRWYWYFLRRRIEILGIPRTSIRKMNDLGYQMATIYNLIMKDAFTVLPLEIQEALNLKNTLGQSYTDRDRLIAIAARKAYKKVLNSSWSAVPESMMIDYIPELVENYGMIHDLKSLYFPQQYKDELSVVSRLKQTMENIPVNQNEVLFEGRGSVRLTDQQKQAVTGALQNPITLITGSAGTGKCLDPDTQVLMFDGYSKMIKNIKVGDQVMGPDSKPRKVLSLGSGQDEMFEIRSDLDESFICNSCHVLTLKGPTPAMIHKKNQFTVVYTIRGKYQSNIFQTELEGLNILESLDEDIFDIPLNEYLKIRDHREMGTCNLIRASIEYPELSTKIHPYLMGQQLALKDRSPSGSQCGLVIPADYIFNSSYNRWKLMAGMFDIFGKSIKTERTELIFKNFGLAIDTKQVLQSLGFAVKLKRLYLGTGAEIEIYGPDYGTEFEVKPLGRGKYCGFELDGDGRFVLENFLVTHNTTIIEQIVENLDRQDEKYAIVAYTGKAVCRIEEGVKSSIKPMTIHRLCYGGWKDEKSFAHLIIDEASMLTVPLLAMIYNKFKHDFSLTLVGDVYQLPPIEWGFIFKQVLESKLFPVYSLTENLRIHQSGTQDGIIINCSNIVKIMKRYESDRFDRSSNIIFDFHLGNNFQIISGAANKVRDVLIELTDLGVESKNIVIITPFNRHISPLNHICQDHFILDKSSDIISNGNIFYRQDIVMMTKNDYQVDIMNGTTGQVKSFHQEPSPFRYILNERNRFLIGSNRELSGYLQIQFITGHTRRFLINQTDYNIYTWANLVAKGTEAGLQDKSKSNRSDYYPVNSVQEWGIIITTIKKIDRYYRKYSGSPANFLSSSDFQPSYMTSWFEPLLRIKFPYGWAGDITHGYAMTAHKAQGSEWHYVITYLGPDDRSSDFLNDRLLYTIFSRAQRSVHCIGNFNLYHISAVRPMGIRYDKLALRLRNYIDTEANHI